ncbi:MAG: hypothetical protein HYV42_02050 [Candidatus Magasanikbacteria bacterium]|nr:hypothetical protein [Candidatus Magasanikbacteria bacterium]
MAKTIDEKIDDLALSVAAGFESVEKRFGSVEERLDNLEKTVNNLPDKIYLDDKIADLKGSLVVKLRREDEKVNFLIKLLRERSVLTPADVKRFQHEFEIFPSAASLDML